MIATSPAKQFSEKADIKNCNFVKNFPTSIEKYLDF